jgi:DNA-binding NarL/FixJ family response regulator
MVQPIRVLVVECEPLFRRGLVGSLLAPDDFEVIGAAVGRDDAFRQVDEHAPDVAVIGSVPSEDMPVQVATEMRRMFPAVATILVATVESDDELFAAIRAGAAAYCGRDIDEAMLHDLIRRAAAGEYVINEQLLSKPYVAARVLDQFRNATHAEHRLAGSFMPLTDRELEILKKVSAGLTNAEIGYSLGISAQTVKNHVTSILRKLAVNDRTQAVVTALRHGWLSIDDEELGSAAPRGRADGSADSSAASLSPRRER